MKTLRVGIASLGEMRDRTIAIARGDVRALTIRRSGSSRSTASPAPVGQEP